MTIDIPQFRRLVADRIAVMQSESVSVREMAAMNRMEVDAFADRLSRSVVVQFRTFIHAIPKEKISVHRRWPKDWREAVKERFAPAWIKKRWPVKYETVDIEQQIYGGVCPHLQEHAQSRHLEWMSST